MIVIIWCYLNANFGRLAAANFMQNPRSKGIRVERGFFPLKINITQPATVSVM